VVGCGSPDQDGRDLWGSAGVCGDLRGSVGICGGLWGSAGICGDLRGSVGICGDLWGSVGICGDLWGSVWPHTLRHSETLLWGPASSPVLRPLAPGKILSRTGRTTIRSQSWSYPQDGQTAPLRTLDFYDQGRHRPL